MLILIINRGQGVIAFVIKEKSNTHDYMFHKPYYRVTSQPESYLPLKSI